MIRYALQCSEGHAFDSWFRSSDDYDRLAKKGGVSCPQCGSLKVEKSLMAPAVSAKTRKGKTAEPALPVPQEPSSVPAPAPQAAPPPAKADNVSLASLSPQAKALREAVRELRRKVEETSDYVGDRFAEEARKIHYEETEPRGIYGEATLEDAKSLHDEGIDVLPLSSDPDEKN